MRWRIALPLCLAIIVGGGLCPSVLADPISDGVAEAARTGKYVLVDFWAEWCGWCKKLDVTMQDPKIAALIHDRFVYVKLDVGHFDKFTDRLKEFKIEGIPFLAVLDGEAKVLGTQPGYLGPDDFAAWLAKTIPAAGEPAAAAEAAPAPATTDAVDIAYLARYLTKMNLKFETDAEKGFCHMVMVGDHAKFDTYAIADTKTQLAFIVIRNYMTVKAGDPNCDKVLRHLMELNWALNVGKFEWGSETGEVRLTFTFSTENGLGYDAFKAVFDTLTSTADKKYEELQKLQKGE